MAPHRDKTALWDERALQILELLRANRALLDAAERHRAVESLLALCRRFGTSERTAPRAFRKLLTHLEYRDRHGIAELARLPAKKVFSSHEAQVAYNRMMPHGLLGRDLKGLEAVQELQRSTVSAAEGRLRQGELSSAHEGTVLAHNAVLEERVDAENATRLQRWEAANAAVRDESYQAHRACVRGLRAAHAEAQEAALTVARKPGRPSWNLF